MSCKRCQVDPQHFGNPRRCAFDAEGAFTPDNWQCATLEVLLDKAQANHYGDDESVQLVPVVFFNKDGLAGGTDGWIVMTRYKSRGCTSSVIHVGDFWPPKPVTLAMAEQQADFHESDAAHAPSAEQREVERLREALRKLANEVSEFLALADLPPHGVTNLCWLELRIDEALAALAVAPKEETR